MRFWDTSAIVPLCVEEPESSRTRGLLRDDPVAVVWWGTHVEVISAMARRVREGGISRDGEGQVKKALGALDQAWSEIQPHQQLRERAERLLSVHALRAADALQLAAALIWCNERTTSREFVCLDQRLADAARLQGFHVLPDL